MVASQNIIPGMVLSIAGKLYRVESSVKVTVPKGTPFIKVKLRDLTSNHVSEKNFKVNQTVTDVALSERKLEFLYLEGNDYLFLDIVNLDQVSIPQDVIGSKIHFLKEGVDLKASGYGETIFAIELPQFLELMVAKVESSKSSSSGKVATLETGATIDVPPFIEPGDIIKVATDSEEYIQRV